jgi:hypothetical protein
LALILAGLMALDRQVTSVVAGQAEMRRACGHWLTATDLRQMLFMLFSGGGHGGIETKATL